MATYWGIMLFLQMPYNFAERAAEQTTEVFEVPRCVGGQNMFG